MEKETLEVYEWRIDNFSYWNVGHCITSPHFGQEYIQQIDLYPRGQIGHQNQGMWVSLTEKPPRVGVIVAAMLVSRFGNLSIIGSDGFLICSKQFHNPGRGYRIDSELKFEDVAAKTKTKGDQLTVRVCFFNEKARAIAVSTTLDVLNLSLIIDPKYIQSMESGDSKNISIIHYSEKNYLDEMLLNAVRKDETIEFVLELLTKTGYAISVESQWTLRRSDKTLVRNEENKYIFYNCGPWKFSNSLMGELVEQGITMHLSLKVINGDKIEKKINAPSEISTVPKKTVCFFDQKSFSNNDSVTSNETGDSVTALLKDFMGLFQDQDYSDIELKCDNVTFPVHRNILSARSPVFKTMFSTDMKEAASSEVEIEDLDPSTLGLFLTYLYTGAVEDLQGESALKLYYAADKYQVPSLKKECSKFLCSNVSISNVCDILSFADKHKDDELTAVSYNFLVNNYNEVLESEEWARFMESEPMLALKTLTQFAQKKYVGKIQ